MRNQNERAVIVLTVGERVGPSRRAYESDGKWKTDLRPWEYCGTVLELLEGDRVRVVLEDGSQRTIAADMLQPAPRSARDRGASFNPRANVETR